MVGRRPKPTAIKEMMGNPGKRPLNECEPRPDGVPTCPRYLSKAARKEWRRVAPRLVAMGSGMLTEVDRAAFACYCQAVGRIEDAERELVKYGNVIKTPKGYPIQNPYLAIANKATDQIRQFAVEFGMTPSSRSRVQVGTAGARDAQTSRAESYFEADSGSLLN